MLGLLAAVAVTTKEQEEEVADTASEKADTANVATDAAAQAAVQLPIALLGTLFSTPLGPGVVRSGAKMMARNLPLLLLIALVGLLFWPSAESAAEGDAAEPDEDTAEPGVREWQPRNGVDRYAA